MTLGLMQPYFLPYLGYYALIDVCDTWVVFDEVQYIRRGWVNRNRILHPAEGWQYIQVPVEKAPRDTVIADMVAKPGWGDKILRQLEHYRKRAPHYAEVTDLLADTFREAPTGLSDLLVHVLDRTCGYLGIRFEPRRSGEIPFDRGDVDAPGDWARIIARELGADRYVNPPGGRGIYHHADFERDGIELRFLEMPALEYHQLRPAFEPHLSVVDVMMFNPPDQIRAMLKAAELTT